MKYLSTRGNPERKRFCEILLEGLAPDGGLYLPEHYPQLDAAALQRLRTVFNGGQAGGYAALAQMQALPTVLAPIVRIRKEELN